MAGFFNVEPVVPGQWGDDTVANTSVHPPIISELHIDLDRSMGDGIGEAFPCFFATEAVAIALAASDLSGFSLAEMKTTGAPDNLTWLQVQGEAGRDDFGISSDNILVLSAAALEFLRPFGLDSADIEPLA